MYPSDIKPDLGWAPLSTSVILRDFFDGASTELHRVGGTECTAVDVHSRSHLAVKKQFYIIISIKYMAKDADNY